MCVISFNLHEGNSYSHFTDGKGTGDLSDAFSVSGICRQLWNLPSNSPMGNYYPYITDAETEAQRS